MHELFADWLQEAGLDVRKFPVASWSDGLDAYRSSVNRDSLPGLLLFATKPDGDESLIPAGLREALKEKDPALQMRDNAFLFAELSRIAVRLLFDEKEISGDLGRAAALGLTVGSFGQKVSAVHAGHLQKANDYLALTAEKLRVRPQMYDLEGLLPKVRDAIEAAADLAHLKEPLIQFVSAISEHSGAVSSHLLEMDEELNILWWLFAESSRDLNRPFAELDRGAAAILAAAELADLVAFPPGPNSAQAFLRRALRVATDEADRPVKIFEAVNALTKDWKLKAKSTLAPLGEASALCPLHLMLAKSYEAAAQEDWPVLVRASCDVSPSLDLNSVPLAMQVLQERMFAASLTLIRDRDA